MLDVNHADDVLTRREFLGIGNKLFINLYINLHWFFARQSYTKVVISVLKKLKQYMPKRQKSLFITLIIFFCTKNSRLCFTVVLSMCFFLYVRIKKFIYFFTYLFMAVALFIHFPLDMFVLMLKINSIFAL